MTDHSEWLAAAKARGERVKLATGAPGVNDLVRDALQDRRRALQVIEEQQQEIERLQVQCEDYRQHAAEWEDVATGNASGSEKALRQMAGLRLENDELRQECDQLKARVAEIERDLVAGQVAELP